MARFLKRYPCRQVKFHGIVYFIGNPKALWVWG